MKSKLSSLPQTINEQVEKDSPLLTMLDRKQVPWRTSVRQIIEKYGIQNDRYYDGRSLYLDNGIPFIEGVRAPFNCHDQGRFVPNYPLRYLSTLVSIGDDPFVNLKHVESELQKYLGPAQEQSFANATGRTWIEPGIGGFTATVWPKQAPYKPLSGPNPAQVRHPFLVSACSIVIEFKYIFPANETERRHIASFKPLHHCKDVRLISPENEMQQVLEFLRKSDSELPENTIGVSRDFESLLLSTEQGFYYIFPRNRVIDIGLETIPPDRDEGYYYEVYVSVDNPLGKDPIKISIAFQRQASEELALIEDLIRNHWYQVN